MKYLITFLTVTLLFSIPIYSVEDQISDSVSPPLSVNVSIHGANGVALPSREVGLNGVTGLILDLDKIGTNRMLCTRYNNTDEFKPDYGRSFKLHSDQTTEDIKYRTKNRTVILISESKSKKYRTVICYYIKHYKGGISKTGVHLGDAKTWRHLTISLIKNDHEVIDLWRFNDDPYNLKLLNDSKPTKRGKSSYSHPATSPKLNQKQENKSQQPNR